MIRTSLVPLVLVLACRPCDDSCTEFVELSLVSASPTGEFASTRYDIVVDAEGRIASCEIDVAAMVGETFECQGDAVVSMGDGSGDDTTGGEPGVRRIVVHWEFAPEVFDVVVRDAANTLVLSNTLTPAYQDQGVSSCDGDCKRFEREIVLPG